MNADPEAFGRLLNYIVDNRITIWFDAAGLHWSAREKHVDAEFLRLLRRFKEPLRQAYGPDRLPDVEPDPKSPQARRKREEGRASTVAARIEELVLPG
jgi:hypothetical protein